MQEKRGNERKSTIPKKKWVRESNQWGKKRSTPHEKNIRNTNLNRRKNEYNAQTFHSWKKKANASLNIKVNMHEKDFV